MKILYLSDDYGRSVMGVKTSLYQEMCRRGHDVVWCDVHSAGVNRIDGRLLKRFSGDQIWIVHTWWELVDCRKEEISAKVIGFGLSDPTKWMPDRVRMCDAYVTSDWSAARQLDSRTTHWMPPSCDNGFHCRLGDIDKTADVLFYGTGSHPSFGSYRCDVIRQLRSALPGIRIAVHGSNWDPDIQASPQIGGQDLVRLINQAKLGIDITTVGAPMARRIFEMPACGTPMICRDRHDIRELFFPGVNCLVWNSVEELTDRIRHYSLRDAQRDSVAANAYEHVRRHHSITNRVDALLQWLPGLPD